MGRSAMATQRKKPGPEPQRATGPQELAESFAKAIRSGRLGAGAQLPTIRALAAEIGTTRANVLAAYRLLQRQGLVEGVVGRGTSVRRDLAIEPRGPSGVAFSPAARAALVGMARPEPRSRLPEGQQLVADFGPGAPDQELFPVREFETSLARVLASRGGELLGYGAPNGEADLKCALARRSDATGDEILITNGAQQGLDLVLRAFCGGTSKGQGSVLVPSPTYHHFIDLARVHGLEVVPIPTGNDGIDLEALARELPRAQLVYVMPTFHNPTGRTLSEAQRTAFMAVVGKTHVPVLADEFQEELRFAGTPSARFRTFDPRGLTLTVHTFSKGLFPGVRIGWLEAPRRLLAPIAALKRLCDLETSPLLQAALADFLGSGVLDRHLQALREQLASRHAAAQRVLTTTMPTGSSWTKPEGGFSLWLELPGATDPERVLGLCAARGVLMTPGRVFDPLDRSIAAFRISLAQVTKAEIEAGLAIVGECAHECLSGSAPIPSPLFL